MDKIYTGFIHNRHFYYSNNIAELCRDIQKANPDIKPVEGVTYISALSSVKTSNAKNVVQFFNVSKSYGNSTDVLQNVSLSIAKGEFVFIIGESGAGKSTMVKMIMHEEVPSDGEIVVNGYRISKISKYEVPYLRRTLGVVFQDFRIIESMTVFDNIAFSLQVTGTPRQEINQRVAKALDIVGLTEKAGCLPCQLSGGECQRTGLARAIVNSPDIIIADEPTGNMDPDMAFDIVKLLSEINRRGITIIMVTHDHELVRVFDKRVIMIEGGKVVADDKARFVIDL